MASFKKGNNLFSSTFSGIEFTFEHYVTLFTDTPYMQWYLGNDSNLLVVFYVQIMPDDFVMQLHRF